MKCSDCKFWQGGKYSEYGDCYRVIVKLEPGLDGCYQDSEEGPESGIYFKVPFDPHDVKEYWVNHPFLRKLIKDAHFKALATKGIRLESQDGCTFIQTKRDYSCYES